MIRKYIIVAKPGIILGNLVSAAGGFFLASRGRIDTAPLLPTLIGMALVVASGCVFNNFIDRGMDRKMTRTRRRVLARGLMSPQAAVIYGSLLGLTGLIVLWWKTNAATAAVVAAGFTVYVALYSLWLKRRSVYGTLIGSLAGAAPPIAGYCAGGGGLDVGAVLLLCIFSLWQMPHSYAIAIFRHSDYTAAAVPVLPVKRGTAAAKRHMTAYTLAFVAATLMLTPAGYTGYAYLTVAAAAGAAWLAMAWAGYRTADERAWAKRVFVSSILTITLLSIMMSVDCRTPAASERLLAWVPRSSGDQGHGGFSSSGAGPRPVPPSSRAGRIAGDDRFRSDQDRPIRRESRGGDI